MKPNKGCLRYFANGMTIEDDVGALIAMGFNRESAEDARAKCNTVEEAVEELMKSPKLISEESSKCDESPAIKSSGSHKGVPVIPVNPGEEVETRRSTGEWVKAIVKDVDNETVWVQYIVDDIIMKKALNYRSPSLRLIEEFQLMDEIEVYAEGDWVEGIVIGENEVAGKRMEIEIQFSVNNKTFRATLNRKSKLIAVRGTHIHKHMVEESSTPQLSKLQQAVNNSATLSPRVSIRNSAAPPSLEWPPLLTGADLIEANGGPLLHGDVFDCVDETGKWCPAEVIEVFENKLKIHFLNYSDKFDQWIDIEQESDRVAPFKANSDNPADPRFVPGELVQIRMGRDLLQAKILKVDGAQMFVSVLDPYGRRRRRWYHLHSRQIWLLERNDDQEGPNETGYEPGNILEWLDDTGKWDWVEVLQCSGKYALVTSDSTYQWVHVVKDQDRIKQLTKSDEEVRLKEETETFSIEIEEKFGLQVIPIPADGNCLFSAIAFLVYGDIAKNAKVRKDCFSYIVTAH